MKNLKNTKFFIMFLSGILFSAFTVFAATISVNTDLTQDAVQYLQNLVLTNSGGAQTGVFLKGSGTSTFYNDLSISGTTTIQDNLTVNGNTLFVNSASNRVGIGTDNPIRTLDVDGTSILNGDTNINGNLSVSNNGNVGNNEIEAETSFAVGGITDNGGEPMDNHNRISGKIKNSMILGEGNEIMGENIYNSIAVGSGNIVYSENENTAVFGNGIIGQTGIKNALIIGEYNDPIPETVFQIGNGEFLHPHNTMTVLKTGGGKVGILNDEPQTALDVGGALRVGYESGCDSTKKGTIVFSGDNHFYGCNGITWKQLDN